jgi:hypothetical protein
MTVTGTVGPHADEQHAVKTGRLEGDMLTLEVEPSDGPAKVTIELKLDGDDRITGGMKFEGNEGPVTGKLDLKREK